MIWLGIVVFFSLHLIPVFPTLRSRLVQRLGENKYKGIYSLIALTGLILIALGYGRMEYQEVWEIPDGARELAFFVMPIVFILEVAAEMKGHIRKKLKHPMMLGILIWAVVHLINNGDLASVLLFGSFGLYSIVSIISTTRRGKLPDYENPSGKHDALTVVIASGLFAVVYWGHEFLFGVSPAF